MQRNGLKISRSKTEYFEYTFGKKIRRNSVRDIVILTDEVLSLIEEVKNVRFSDKGECNKEDKVYHGCIKWRELRGDECITQ